MPNNVKNIVKMEGITKLPLFEMEDGVMCFDFNKLVPMPKSLEVESGSIEALAFEAVNRKLSQRSYFQRVYFQPKMSDEEYQMRVKSYGKTEKKLLELGLQYISNKIQYGAISWYDWCCDNWGDKVEHLLQ